MRRSLRAPQAGFGMVELVLAGFLAFTLLSMAGYLFRSQVQGYRDIRDQARIQAAVKKALQAMTRRISNAGGGLPDPMAGFSPKADRLTFAYLDLGGAYCGISAKTIMSFHKTTGNSGDTLMQDIDCGGGKHQSRPLASVPAGSLGLSFRYLDKAGEATMQPGQIKSVELNLNLMTGKAKAGERFRKTREQIIRVQCVNL
jgi:hypothetical protein